MAAERGVAHIQCRCIFGGCVPAPCLLNVRKFDDDQRPRMPLAFQRLHLAAAHQIAPAILFDGGSGARTICLDYLFVADCDIGNDIGSHSVSPACSPDYLCLDRGNSRLAGYTAMVSRTNS